MPIGCFQAAWIGRERMKFVLPRLGGALEPGDLVALVGPPRTFHVQLTRLSDGEDRRRRPFPSMPPCSKARPGRSAPPACRCRWPTAARNLHFLDVPRLPGMPPDEAGYVAAAASPWPGRVAVYKSPGTDFALQTLVRRPAITGALLSPLYAGPLYRWDDGNSIYLEVYAGGLSSANDLAVLNGANACAVQNADGEWEIIQFGSAELVGPDRYLLTRLLRGQLGTENAMRNPVETGATFVLLDAAVEASALKPAEARLPLNYRFGPAQKPPSDASFVAAAHTYSGVPNRPYAPVQVRAVKEASGAITLTWVRRTREGGDDWDAVEVPLGETGEAYAVEILSGAGALLRTLSVSGPTASYTSADQTTDFGGAAPSPLNLRVYQVSPSFGRGAPASGLVYFG